MVQVTKPQAPGSYTYSSCRQRSSVCSFVFICMTGGFNFLVYMTSKMGAEKMPIFYLAVPAAAVACHRDAPHTCTVVVHRSKLEIKKLGALKVQGPFVTTLCTEALLCR